MSNYRFGFYYFCVYLPSGVYNTFFSLWLIRRGLSVSDAAIVLAIPYIVRMAADPFWGWVADRYMDRKRLMMILTFSTTILYTCHIFAPNFIWITALTIACSITWTAVIPIGESVASLSTESSDTMEYGTVRLFGSISALLMSLIVGFLVDAFANAEIFFLVVSFSMTLLSISLLEFSNNHVSRGFVRDDDRNGNALVVVLVSAAAAMCLGSHSLLYLLGAVHWHAIGHSAAEIGFFWSCALVSEVIVFYLSRYRIWPLCDPIKTIFFCSCFGVVRWWGLSMADSAVEIVAVQVLQGATMAGVVLGLMELSKRYIGRQEKSFFFGRIFAVSHGLVPLIITLVGGQIFVLAGAGAFLLGAVLSALSMALVVVARWREEEDH